MPDENKNSIPHLQAWFLAALIIIAVVINYLVLAPYLAALFVAVIFAVSWNPVNNWLLRLFKGKGAIAAFFSVILLVVVILLPFLLFGYIILEDARRLYIELSSGSFDKSALSGLFDNLKSRFGQFLPGVSFEPAVYIREAASFITSNVGRIFSGFVFFVFQAFLMLLALFYFFKDGTKLRKSIVMWSPLDDGYDEIILDKLKNAINSVVRGVLLVALAQGVVSGVGYSVLGVPNPVLWAAVTAVAALIPTVGTSIVIAPIIAYLFFASGLGPAVGLLIWGVAAVGLVDNLLAPILINRGLHIHPLFILLSVLGGIIFFGPIGFLAGPVSLSLLFAFLDVYKLASGTETLPPPKLQ
ncbi:MAG: AI-2E family transporter [bacterium]|nr:AI-2E family transporter [bacterium]